ncbi:MAG TPA: dTDP-4-dehydrorhamnose 3,5-epimerase [Candidatus Gastranaerophilales bacterium]|nr:dTDP-4-dehydrorhamnose 3,5-epimerase [Candidatus Gastranaerophilales bacterium]
MKFIKTTLKDAYVIEIEPICDQRGFFARSFCKKEFIKRNLNPDICQCNISYSQKAGTLRGMHFQKPPYEETKLVSCIKGAIYDVIIDLRKDSETYCQWFAQELTQENHKMMYVPKGFAHGFQALKDDTIISYKVGEFYNPEYEAGVRWDDSAFSIIWPECENRTISEKDSIYSNYER